MTQPPQFEHIRAQAALVIVGPLSDEEIERIAKCAPAFFHLLECRASGRLAGGQRVIDRFLRRLSEPLFNHLVAEALGFFRRDGGGALSLEAAPQLIGHPNYQFADNEAKAEAINDLAKRLRLQTRKTLPDKTLEDIIDRAQTRVLSRESRRVR